MPNEVREWLATTFTKNNSAQKRRSDDKPKFRSVANAIRAGIMVDRSVSILFSSLLLFSFSFVVSLTHLTFIDHFLPYFETLILSPISVLVAVTFLFFQNISTSRWSNCGANTFQHSSYIKGLCNFHYWCKCHGNKRVHSLCSRCKHSEHRWMVLWRVRIEWGI